MKKKSKGFIWFIILGLIIYNCNDLNYTYFKYNNTIYILSSRIANEQLLRYNPEKIDIVSKRIPLLFTPKNNNESNGIPKGTKVFKTNTSALIIMHKHKYYLLVKSSEENLINAGILRLR